MPLITNIQNNCADAILSSLLLQFPSFDKDVNFDGGPLFLFTFRDLLIQLLFGPNLKKVALI